VPDAPLLPARVADAPVLGCDRMPGCAPVALGADGMSARVPDVPVLGCGGMPDCAPDCAPDEPLVRGCEGAPDAPESGWVRISDALPEAPELGGAGIPDGEAGGMPLASEPGCAWVPEPDGAPVAGSGIVCVCASAADETRPRVSSQAVEVFMIGSPESKWRGRGAH